MPVRNPNALVKTNLRIREDVRRRLESEAKRRNTSLNSEMARRLERSLDQNEREAEIWGGRRTEALLRVISSTIQEIEARSGKLWHEDRETQIQASLATIEMVRMLTGVDEERPPEEIEELEIVGSRLDALEFEGTSRPEIFRRVGEQLSMERFDRLKAEMTEREIEVEALAMALQAEDFADDNESTSRKTGGPALRQGDLSAICGEIMDRFPEARRNPQLHHAVRLITGGLLTLLSSKTPVEESEPSPAPSHSSEMKEIP